jgi:hypothetical protein
MPRQERNALRSAYITALRRNADRTVAKYNRNWRAYEGTMGISVRKFNVGMPLGFLNTAQIDYLDDESLQAMLTRFNVVKSVVDTLVSKVASTKVRPYFNPVLGDYNTRKIVKQLQLFFDDYFEKQDVPKKIIDAFRDACIFDRGILWANNFTFGVDAVSPDQVAIFESEFEYGLPTKCLLKFTQFPVTHLNIYGIKEPTGIRLDCLLEIFYDVVAHEVTLLLDGVEVRTDKYEGTQIPLIYIYYSEPAVGDRNTSLTDVLFPTQLRINSLCKVIEESCDYSQALTYFTPKGSIAGDGALTNRVGNIFEYTALPNQTTPPIYAQYNPPVDPSWISTLEFFIEKAYSLAGISQLSAQSRAPANLSSGVALQSMENIESDRFQTQISTVIQAYTALCKMLIHIFPPNATLLPDKARRSKISWKEVVKQSELVEIQYSAATFLSKDPAEKLKQIMAMIQSGIIDAERAKVLMEQPDLEIANSLLTARMDAVDAVIQNVLDTGAMNLPPYVNYELLKREVDTELNRLTAIGEEEQAIYIERLSAFNEQLFSVLIEQGLIPNPDEVAAEQDKSKTLAKATLVKGELAFLTDIRKKLSDTEDGSIVTELDNRISSVLQLYDVESATVVAENLPEVQANNVNATAQEAVAPAAMVDKAEPQVGWERSADGQASIGNS